VIDASGPRGFLHRALQLAEIPFPNLPPTQGLYSHFTNVRRFGDLNRDLAQRAESGSPFSPDSPPYPVDDAAMHHVFDGGWIWILRFNNGLTSAGVAAIGRLADELNLAEGNARVETTSGAPPIGAATIRRGNGGIAVRAHAAPSPFGVEISPGVVGRCSRPRPDLLTHCCRPVFR
jgi:hypothetical protein